MRVVIADDALLVRSGVVTVLGEAGIETVGEAGSVDQLMRLVQSSTPEAAIVDIKMPPSHSDEGIRAAATIRRLYPNVAVLVLSQYLESSYALRLLQESPASVGYLLKDRVAHASTLVDALVRVVGGETVVDPAIITRLLTRAQQHSPIDDLTNREREVLALMAEGRSNVAVGHLLFLSPKTVETHVSRVFSKLGLHEQPDDHRRVLAVLTFLRQGSP
jgi:DNA-binding NarL/FixJ family response regulator